MPDDSPIHCPDGISPARHIEELYAGVTEISPDAIVVIDEDGKVMIFNRHAELMFGYHRSAVLGAKVETLLPAGIREKHVEHRMAYMQDPKTREMGQGLKLMALHRNGKEFAVQIKLSPMVTQSGTHIVAVVRRMI